MIRNISLFIVAYAIVHFSLINCVQPIYPYTTIAPGIWRAELYIDPNRSINAGIQDRRTEGEVLHQLNDVGILPFLFEVIYANDSTWHIEIINGSERIIASDIAFGRSRSDADEVLKIDFPIYDSHIEAVVKEGTMQGHFVARSKDNYRIPFAAFHGKNNRFHQQKTVKEPLNVQGKYEVTFDVDADTPYKAIGEFKQVGNNVTGTFITETGDYRYLEGIVAENKLWLSVFDGAHAFLFHAKIQGDGSMQGIFRSGKHYQNNWEAKRNEAFEITPADSLSKSITDDIEITFPNSQNELITFPKPASKNVKILQIMGTWCPNCKDETLFLIDFLKTHPQLNLDITAVAFERYKDESRAIESIGRYKEKLGIPYDILYGGPASKAEASKVMSMVDRVISYPTMIIMDKSNNVRKVHTGFYGPATSKFKDFERDFTDFILALSNE